jgi:rod shape determining protein RodA
MTLGYPSSSYPRPGGGVLGSDRRRTGSTVAILRRLDWVLLAAVGALSLLGTVLVYAATRQRLTDAGADPQTYLKKHILNIVIGIGLGAGASLINYRALRAYAPLVFVVSLFGLVVVLSPLGSTVNGSHSWITLPAGLSIQPSEFAKLALCVCIAMLLSEKRDGEENPRGSDVLTVLVVTAVPVGLIMLQPDLGTTLIIGCILIGMLAMAGTSNKWLFGLLAVAVLGTFVALQGGVLKSYQTERLTTFTNPNGANSSKAGYQLEQGQIAIGSGGITGKGLFDGSQTDGGFIPEQETDFVFTVAGEELGFVGGAALIVLTGAIIWRGLRIAVRAPDMYGRLVAVGIVCWFTFQAFENIGMTLGIMPMTGVPLPFVSYGGSSMFATMMGVGLLQNVHASSVE